MNNFLDNLYADIYSVGDGYKRFFAKTGKKVFAGISRVLRKLFLLISGLCLSYFRHVKRYWQSVKREGKQFFSEVKGASPALKASFRENPFKGIKKFFGYVFKSFKVHEKFNRAVLSSVIPVYAVVFLLSFYAAYTHLAFAVNVYVDGSFVGTVRDEYSYKEAETQAHKRFSATAEESAIPVPVYKITLTTVDSIDDSETVADNIIRALSDKTVNACGVYIDGEYICAVRSVDTFNRVTSRVLNDYAKANGFDKDNCTVEFNCEIVTSTGLYPDNEKVLSAEEFYGYLAAYDSEKTEHTVAKDESIDDILNAYGLTRDELFALNPELNADFLPEGSVILVKEDKKNISIKATVTTTSVETTDFQSVMQYDNNLYVGTSMTIIEGVPGRDVVSYTDTYIDGVLVSRGTELSRYNANEPVNELIKIGTLGISGTLGSASPRLTRDQGGTFIWPAPDNCFWLSQGYNPARSHYGIDIVSSDDGSCKGRRIVSVADGVVVLATYHYSWGYYIRVDHGDGVVTGYAHALQGSFRVNVGDFVRAGQHLSSIGTTGNSTGYHLHFEVWLDGTRVNPLPYVYSQYTGVATG